MTLKEKYQWMTLYTLEFGAISVLMFIFGLGGPDVVILGGSAVAAGMVLITLVLLFRITYLKGKARRV